MLTRPEIGTREHALLWLASKPTNQAYRWHYPSLCAAGQYHEEFLADTAWTDDATLWLNRLAHVTPHTFGALYERAIAEQYPSTIGS